MYWRRQARILWNPTGTARVAVVACVATKWKTCMEEREEQDWWKFRKVLGSYLVTLAVSETLHIYSPVGKK